MQEFILSDGSKMTLENGGDTLLVKLWNEDGEYVDERCWDIDSIAEMLFD